MKRLVGKVSKSSQTFLWKLYNSINEKENRNIYFHELNKEYFISSNGMFYLLDFYDHDRKICIEYNGDYWHKTPERIKYDKEREKILNENGINVITIWESDRNKDINKEIQRCLEVLNE